MKSSVSLRNGDHAGDGLERRTQIDKGRPSRQPPAAATVKLHPGRHPGEARQKRRRGPEPRAPREWFRRPGARRPTAGEQVQALAVELDEAGFVAIVVPRVLGAVRGGPRRMGRRWPRSAGDSRPSRRPRHRPENIARLDGELHAAPAAGVRPPLPTGPRSTGHVAWSSRRTQSARPQVAAVHEPRSRPARPGRSRADQRG